MDSSLQLNFSEKVEIVANQVSPAFLPARRMSDSQCEPGIAKLNASDPGRRLRSRFTKHLLPSVATVHLP